MADWHYLKGDTQFGPVSDAQLKELATAGKVESGDFVWREGMAEWVPAARLPGLFTPRTKSAATMVATEVEAPGPQVDFTPTADLNTKAAAVLRGFAAVTGSRGQWPVSEEDLALIAVAARHRIPIRRAAALYLVLFYCGVGLSVALGAYYLLYAVRADQFARTLPAEAAQEVLVPAAVIAGLSVLSLFASRATDKCHVWGLVAMIVQFSGWLTYLTVKLVRALQLFTYDPTPLVLVVTFMIPFGVFLGMSVRALTSVRKFLRKPLWCVHLLVSAKL